MRYEEKSIFDNKNRKLLMYDFYDSYYYIDQIILKEKQMDILEDGYRLFLDQILVGINMIKDMELDSFKKELYVDYMDYTTTLHGVLLVVVEQNYYKCENYKLWIEAFEYSINKAY